MCGCDGSFVCTRCAATPHDWRYWHDPEPESTDELRERLTREHADQVVWPAVDGRGR